MTGTQELPQTKTPGVLRKAVRATLRTTLTLGVAAVALIAIQAGSQELARRADAAPSPDPAPVIPVQTTRVVLSSHYDVTRAFTGQIEAQRTAAISFELAGQLDNILVDEGDTVTQGQLIASLDTRLLRAERDRLSASKDAIAAQLRFAEQTVTRQSQLNTKGFASQAAMDEALSRADELGSRIAELEAALLGNAIQLEKSKIHAPFDGRITNRLVDGKESIAPGQPLVELVEGGAPLLRVGVPLDLTTANLAAASVNLGDETHDAELVTLRPDVDPVTRTRTALFRLPANAKATYGQTARLVLTESVDTQGVWVPVTSLKEGLRGQWTLLAVDADNRVRAMVVQVLHSEKDRVFVRGALDESIRLITAGPQRVTVGQTVNPQPAL